MTTTLPPTYLQVQRGDDLMLAFAAATLDPDMRAAADTAAANDERTTTQSADLPNGYRALRVATDIAICDPIDLPRLADAKALATRWLAAGAFSGPEHSWVNAIPFTDGETEPSPDGHGDVPTVAGWVFFGHVPTPAA